MAVTVDMADKLQKLTFFINREINEFDNGEPDLLYRGSSKTLAQWQFTPATGYIPNRVDKLLQRNSRPWELLLATCSIIKEALEDGEFIGVREICRLKSVVLFNF